MQYGQNHKFGNLYLANCANEAAYREDTRRFPNGDIFNGCCQEMRSNKDEIVTAAVIGRAISAKVRDWLHNLTWAVKKITYLD